MLSAVGGDVLVAVVQQFVMPDVDWVWGIQAGLPSGLFVGCTVTVVMSVNWSRLLYRESYTGPQLESCTGPQLENENVVGFST